MITFYMDVTMKQALTFKPYPKLLQSVLFRAHWFLKSNIIFHNIFKEHPCRNLPFYAPSMNWIYKAQVKGMNSEKLMEWYDTTNKYFRWYYLQVHILELSVFRSEEGLSREYFASDPTVFCLFSQAFACRASLLLECVSMHYILGVTK